MKSPFTGKEMSVGREWRDMTYRKEIFPIVFHYYECEDSGEKFEDDHFSELNYNQVLNQYRVRHHIPFPEQISETRHKYGLSQARMSEILGLGTNSWRNYEAGEMPSKSNAALIQLMSQPDVFEQHIKINSELDEKEREPLLKHVQKLKSDICFCQNQLVRFQGQPDIASGFKAFDINKTKQIILFFAEKLQPFKTKLNKLLFYSDFVNFRSSAKGITGMKYMAIQHGPVPMYYDYLYEVLEGEGIIKKEYYVLNGGEVEQIVSAGNFTFDPSLFSEIELNSLNYISEKFRLTSATDIADISHLELAWKDNYLEKRIIPFLYAFDLETV